MMASARTWNLRLNLDEFNALAASLYNDADRALALQGLALGMNAGPCPPDFAPDAFRRGWSIGNGMRTEADEFRTAQADRGKASAAKRLERTGSAQPQKPTTSGTGSEPPFEPPFEPGFEPPVEPNHNPQSTILETTTDKHPPKPPKGERARMVPPTEQEWVAYCTTTWSDWHPECAAESWAYYQSKGWRIGSAPCRDWKAVARTAHGNARQWGRLQPQPNRSNGRQQSAPSFRAGADQALAAQLEGRRNGNGKQNPAGDPAEVGW